jgi:hypothetical protein
MRLGIGTKELLAELGMNTLYMFYDLKLNEAGFYIFNNLSEEDCLCVKDVCKAFITGLAPLEKVTPAVAEHVNPDNTPKGYLLSWWIQCCPVYISRLRYGSEWIALHDSIPDDIETLSTEQRAHLLAQWLVRFHDLRKKVTNTQTIYSRVFIIITAYLNSKKALGNYRRCALVNLKRNGPDGWGFEGKCHLFGGAINPWESPLEAAARELEEELPGLLSTPEQLKLLDTINEYVFYTYDIGMITEQDVRQIAFSCQEGMLDVRFNPLGFSDWISPAVPDLISLALK